MFKRKGRRSAFTLIELMLVIAIMLILAGALLPIINASRLDARMAKAWADVDSIKLAAHLLHADTGEWPDSGSTGNGLINNVTGASVIPDWGGPYLDSWRTDPWNNPYLIVYGASNQIWAASSAINGTGDCVSNNGICNGTVTTGCDVCVMITPNYLSPG